MHEPLQAVVHIIQRQIQGNSATNTLRRNEILETPPEISEGEGNNKIVQWMESTIVQNSNKKIKEWHNTKRETSKQEAPVASTSKPQVNQPPQEGKKKNKKNWKKQ
ncbi:hypothetical protein O181_055053 [Austropuccinia psidii MF-1]|uniref:Uncharacterized protein n=1 Tax=Austropuccinia psidii MF-1 TaxID=1389203 RepID=A0A9Q3EAF0_9BASI|nr:hypothetical protein [Austropuccinia psidii MF-1]